MRSTLVVCVTLVALSWVSGHADDEDAAIIDQMQADIDASVGGLAIGGPSQQMLAQTVTVGHSGELAGILLPVSCDSGELVIEVRALDGDRPGATVLRQRRVAAEKFSAAGPKFRLFRLGGDLWFAEGDRFAVVLRSPNGSCGIFQAPVGDLYPRGEAFFDARPNQPGWVPFSDTQTAVDLPFMILLDVDVETPNDAKTM